MKWVIIKGVRYPGSVISAFAAYNMDNPFLKVRIRNKYHIVPFDDVNKMVSQMVYLMDNYPDFVQIGGWWISKKAVMSWVPKGQAVDGSGWVISFTLSFGLEGGTQSSSIRPRSVLRREIVFLRGKYQYMILLGHCMVFSNRQLCMGIQKRKSCQRKIGEF